MKRVIGVVLLSLGVSIFLLTFFRATVTDIVIDDSFVLESGEKHETYHHTRVIGKSSLTGELLIESDGINFTAYGYNTQHLSNIHISQNYSFIIDPADDLYTFIFKNVQNAQSSIRFILIENWMSTPLLILSFVGLILAPIGLIMIIMSLRK